MKRIAGVGSFALLAVLMAGFILGLTAVALFAQTGNAPKANCPGGPGCPSNTSTPTPTPSPEPTTSPTPTPTSSPTPAPPPTPAPNTINPPIGGSYKSFGPVTVNLGSLDIHLSVPIFSKPGRGIPLNYTLEYDSQIWATGGSPLGVSALPTIDLGWHRGGPFGWVQYNTFALACPGGTTANATQQLWNDYFDLSGNAHVFNVTEFTPGNLSKCQSTPAGTYLLRDGSGLSDIVNSSGGFGGLLAGNGSVIQPFQINPTFTLTTSGSTLTETMTGATFNTGASITDSNGNVLSASISPPQITDTIGEATFPIGGSFWQPTSFGYTDSNGDAQSISIQWRTYNVQPNFCGFTGGGLSSGELPQSVTYPDGSSESFTYEMIEGSSTNTTGRLASVTLRTGATIQFAYSGGSNGMNCADGSTAGITVTTTDGEWNFTHTSPTTTSNGDTSTTTTVTDAKSNQMVVNFLLGLEVQRQIYQGSAGGTLLQTIATCYNQNKTNCATTQISALPISELSTITTIPNGNAKETDTSFNTMGETTEVDESLWGVGGVGGSGRSTLIKYATLGNGILNKPSSITVFDATTAPNTQMAQTTFGYDESAVTTITEPQLVSVSGSRGNLTSVHKWLNTSNSLLPPTTMTYDSAGQVISSTDPKGTVATFSYDCDDAFSATVTQVFSASSSHDCNMGLMLTSTDANNQETKYAYDEMGRPTAINYPDGGQTTVSYPFPTETITQIAMNGSQAITSYAAHDGYGRISRTARTNGEPNNIFDQQDFSYDPDGLPSFTSYPYQGSGFGSAKVTSGAGDSTTYDGMGRVTQVTHSDGTSINYVQEGRNVQITDESGNSRILKIDGLGRLVNVCELYSGATLAGSGGTPANCHLDLSGTGLLTTYGYDILNNLISVTQPGVNPRTYTYDSLSRLLSSTDPESGTTCYGTYSGTSCQANGYDTDSNLLSRTDPRGIVTSYSYDSLNRLTQVNYSDGVTPQETFVYDSGPGWSGPFTNMNGRLAEIYTGPSNGFVTASAYSYDPMGRVIMNNQVTPTAPSGGYQVGYTYDLAGDMLTSTVGNGVTATYAYNIGGRPTSITSSFEYPTFPGTLLSQAHYNAFGERVSASYGDASTTSSPGTGATAAVTISGYVNNARSGGKSPVPAVSGSPLTSINGQEQVFYLGTNQHVMHLFFSSPAWENQDLTAITDGDLPAMGTSLSSNYNSNDANPWQLYFVGTNQHVYQLYCCSSSWQIQDITAQTSAPTAAGSGSLTSVGTSDSSADHVFYLASDNHVHENYFVNGSPAAWHTTDDTAKATGAPAAAPGSPLTSYVDISGIWHVAYLGANQHVYLITCCSSYEDLTQVTNGEIAASTSSLTSWTDSYGYHVAYVGANQHVYTFYNGGSWGDYDITQSANATNLAASNSPLTAYEDGKTEYLYYVGTDQNVYLLTCCGWSNQNVSTEASSGGPTASNSGLTSFTDSFGQHAIYEGTNGDVYQLFNSGTWADQDLFGISNVTLADSGTVSLDVAGFTATACYGHSSQSSCIGETNDFATDVASALAAALNSSSSPVNATVSGPTISVTLHQNGNDNSLIPALSSSPDNSSLFPKGSFSSQATNFAGGSIGGPAGISETRTFDSRGRALSVFTQVNGGNGLEAFGPITYYPNGNINQVPDGVSYGTSTYTYDALKRLASVSYTNPSNTTVNYTYDASGNLWAKSNGWSQAFDANNHIVAFSYDAAGNLLSDKLHTYTYDAEGRLSTVDGGSGNGGTTYTYDALGRRVQRVNSLGTYSFTYDLAGRVAYADTPTTWTRGEVYAGRNHIATYSSGQVYFDLHDWLGNERVKATQIGSEQQDFASLPFGDGQGLWGNAVGQPGPTLFTGDDHDSESNTEHTWFRQYSSAQGRWLTPDPLGIGAARLSHPQSLNQYAYVNDNPVNHADRKGLLLDPDEYNGWDFGGLLDFTFDDFQGLSQDPTDPTPDELQQLSQEAGPDVGFVITIPPPDPLDQCGSICQQFSGGFSGMGNAGINAFNWNNAPTGCFMCATMNEQAYFTADFMATAKNLPADQAAGFYDIPGTQRFGNIFAESETQYINGLTGELLQLVGPGLYAFANAGLNDIGQFTLPVGSLIPRPPIKKPTPTPTKKKP